MTLQEAMQTLAALGNEKVRARHRKLGSGDNLFGVQMGDLRKVAAPETQWTMNNSLAGIGSQFPELRARALAIGERLGIFRDYPVSKGCSSPFAPIWIAEMVRRKG